MAGPDETGAIGMPLQQTDLQMRQLTELRTRTREYSQDLRALGNAGRDTGELLARAFTSAAVKGKDLSSTFKSLILSLGQKTLRSAASSFQGALTSSLKGMFSGPVRNANGNVFAQGRIIPLARGGVVSGPTLFPMSGGATGLMGEAGPEAVMPLTRGADGRLGCVRAVARDVLSPSILMSPPRMQKVCAGPKHRSRQCCSGWRSGAGGICKE